MTDDWHPGAVVKQGDEAEVLHLTGSHQVDVAVGLDPRGGDAVVLLRFGSILAVLTPDGAASMGQSLAECAAIAYRHNEAGGMTQ